MKQKVFIGTIITFLIISIFANFFSPLICVDEENVILSLNVKDTAFQPLFISKRGGVTELINASFRTDRQENGKVRVDTIIIKPIRLSGLIDHKLSDVLVSVIKRCNNENCGAECKERGCRIDSIPCISMSMRFMKGKKEDTVFFDKQSREVIEAFQFYDEKPYEIITRVDYGYDPLLTDIIEKLKKNKELEISEINHFLDPQTGSICNINAIYE